MLVEMENCRVLVSDQKIELMKDIIPVLEQITRQNQPLLIVTEDITGTLCSLQLGHCICKLICCEVICAKVLNACWGKTRIYEHAHVVGLVVML